MEWPAKARPRQRVARGGGWSGPGCWVGGEGGARMGPFSVPAPAASAGHADRHGPRDLGNRPVAPVGQLLQPQ